LIKAGAFGQPIVYFSEEEKNQVSISHSGYKAAALSFPQTHPMGIDLEERDLSNSKILSTHLSFQEEAIVESLSSCSLKKKTPLFSYGH
jgi:4'-phosphopantetheinyl transferase